MRLTDQVCQQITNTIKTLRLTRPRLIVIDVVYSDGWRMRVRKSLEAYQARVLALTLAQHFPYVAFIARDTIGPMAYLGPPEGAYLPQPLRDACLELVHKYTTRLSGEEQRQKLVQVALALGALSTQCPEWHWTLG